MALTASQRDLYRRLVAAGVWQFPGNEAQQEILFKAVIDAVGGGFDGADSAAPLDYARRVALFDAAGDRQLHPLSKLGVYVLPDATGHPPNLSDKTVGAAYAALNLPCIVSSQVLYARPEVVPGHAARAVWAPLDSTVGSASVGMEQVTAAAVGQEVKTGDRRSRTVAGITAYYVANRDFTIGAGVDGLPGDAGTTGWDNSERLAADAGFKGVVYRSSEISNPVVGDWIYGVVDGIAAAERYATMGGTGWYSYYPPGIAEMLGVFADTDEALSHVTGFSGSERTAAIIDGKLQYLTYYNPPTLANTSYHWRSRARSPVAPYRIASLAAQARLADEWYALGENAYKTLLELGAQWFYVEGEVDVVANITTVWSTCWLRLGALKSVAADTHSGGLTTTVNWSDSANNAGPDTLLFAYDGDNLRIRDDAGARRRRQDRRLRDTVESAACENCWSPPPSSLSHFPPSRSNPSSRTRRPRPKKPAS